MPNHVVHYVRERGISQRSVNLEDAVRDSDVLYMTRIQNERFATQEEYDKVSITSLSSKTLLRALNLQKAHHSVKHFLFHYEMLGIVFLIIIIVFLLNIFLLKIIYVNLIQNYYSY